MIKVINSLECSVLVVNTERKIVFANKYFLDKANLIEKDILYKDLLQVISIVNNTFNNLVENISDEISFYFKLKNKEESSSTRAELVEDTFNGNKAYFLIGKNGYQKRDLENLLDVIQTECWIKNTEGKYIYVNQEFANSLDCEKSEIIGKTSRDFFNENDWRYFERCEKKVVESKNIIHNENVYITRKNKKWYSNTIGPIFDENNNIKYIACCKLDITYRKFLNDTLKEILKQMMELSNNIRKFDVNSQYDSLLKYVTKKIVDYTNADGANIIYFDEKTYELKTMCSYGEVIKGLEDIEIKKQYGKIFYDFVKNYNGQMLKCDNVIINDKLKKFYFNHIKNKFYAIGVYCINLENKVKGTLLLTYKNEHFSRTCQKDYIVELCSYISVHIENLCKYKEIEKEKSRYKNISSSLMKFIDTSTYIVLTINHQGRIIYYNYQALNIFGSKKLTNMYFSDLLYQEDYKEIKNMILNSEENLGSIIIKMNCLENETKWIDWTFKSLEKENSIVFIGKDVNNKIEEEKKKFMIQQAQIIEDIRDEFLANITHELRTPLNIILGVIQLMSKKLDNNTYKIKDLNCHINYLKRNSNRLLRLVNNLIDITYIKNGYHQLNLQNNNLTQIIKGVCDTIIANKENRNRVIVFEAEPNDIIMACDSEEIVRIVLNLLSNAIKYSFPNTEIKVSVKQKNNKAEISVKDQGIGIPKEYLDTIFENLTRLDNDIRRSNEGSGIGLAIVKSLVNLHNGDIKVESEVGKGSNFIVILPIKLINNQNTSNTLYENNNKLEKCSLEFSDIYDYN